jgi:hypothetical protein
MSVLQYKKLLRKVVFEYLEKYEDLPTRTIARMLKRDYSEYFKDIENARGLLKYYRGLCGDWNRKNMATKKYYKNAV